MFKNVSHLLSQVFRFLINELLSESPDILAQLQGNELFALNLVCIVPLFVSAMTVVSQFIKTQVLVPLG